jgi:hypothetical protein
VHLDNDPLKAHVIQRWRAYPPRGRLAT